MSTTAVVVQDCDPLLSTTAAFRLSLARNMDDLTACQRLRYVVFNCELGEGLAEGQLTGLDRDRFDVICDHLMVHDALSGELVGTYRMQTGYRAKANLGYYSEQLFDMSPFEPIRGQLLELGRACVRHDYRNTTALFMLWKGIAMYAGLCNARYLIGCSSLTSQDENEGMEMYRALTDKYLVDPPFRTLPQPSALCHAKEAICELPLPRPPRLFRAYLEISARLCGPPAIDREFKTIDFLTFLDLQAVPERVRTRFF
jgi:putative hemolysin